MSPFRIGLNPYGLTVRLGIQGEGTQRHPAPWSVYDFVDFALAKGARSIEFHGPHIEAMTIDARHALAHRLASVDVVPVVAYGPDLTTLPTGIQLASDIGASTLRLGLSTILEGARARLGDQWPKLKATVSGSLNRYAPLALEQGINFAIEDHQDFGSEELVAFCEAAGPNVGITFDTANPLSVGEDIEAFALRAKDRVIHLHLKDYVTTWTSEGYRLIRCPIGDGVVPLQRLAEIFADRQDLTASIEIAALSARHIRLFAEDWWKFYPERSARELAAALHTAANGCLTEGTDWRTPFEQGLDGTAIGAWEIAQVEKSFHNLRALGWIS